MTNVQSLLRTSNRVIADRNICFTSFNVANVGFDNINLTHHAAERALNRGVSSESISDALTHPLRKRVFKIDEDRRFSQRFIGSKAEAVISIQNVKINPKIDETVKKESLSHLMQALDLHAPKTSAKEPLEYLDLSQDSFDGVKINIVSVNPASTKKRKRLAELS